MYPMKKAWTPLQKLWRRRPIVWICWCTTPRCSAAEGMKRLCFVSSEAGAVSVAHREDLSSYCMSKTALNMALRLMFNQLQPMGYSFRLFHPGWVRSPKIEHSTDAIPTFRDQEGNLTGKFWPWETAAAAVPQFIEDREFEDRLVLIDNEGTAWPF